MTRGLAARWQAPAAFPELLGWLDSPWMTCPFAGGQTFRVEDYAEDGRYVIRAELPGLDPDQDIEVTVEDGTLTIHAERREGRLTAGAFHALWPHCPALRHLPGTGRPAAAPCMRPLVTSDSTDPALTGMTAHGQRTIRHPSAPTRHTRPDCHPPTASSATANDIDEPLLLCQQQQRLSHVVTPRRQP